MHEPRQRRIGLSDQHKGKLLNCIGGVSREEYDSAKENVPQNKSDTKDVFNFDELSDDAADTKDVFNFDELSDDAADEVVLKPTNFTTRSPSKKAKTNLGGASPSLHAAYSTDDLAKPDAPSISKPPVPVKTRSRQPSIDPKAKTVRGKQKTLLAKEPDEETPNGDFNTSNLLGSFVAGKTKDQAVKDASRSGVREPGLGWDYGNTRRKPVRKVTYKSRGLHPKTSAFRDIKAYAEPVSSALLPRAKSTKLHLPIHPFHG